MDESKPGSKAPIILGGIIIAVGLVALAVLSGGPSLPASDKMSETFKKAAYEAWLDYHEVGLCGLSSQVKPENTADQQVRELFDECLELDRKRLEFQGKLPTDDLNRQYNDIVDDQKKIKGEIDAIFRAQGYENADTILRKRLEDSMKRRK